MSDISLRNGADFLVYREASGGTVEIVDIAVTSERRRGRGKELIHILKEQVPPGTHLIWAMTRESNWVAHRFYENCGFHLVSVVRQFYRAEHSRREAAYIFGLEL